MKAKLKTLMAAATFAVVGAVAALPAAAADDMMQEINFGIISTESQQNLRATWDPMLDDMASYTGMKVNAFFAPDYAGIIEAMRFNKVQVAWFGNKSAMEAVDRAGGEIFVQTVDVEGNPGYWSLLVTSVDSPLNSLKDVLKCDKSLNFGNGDPNSTSGFLVPSYYVFAANNVTPQDCFKRVVSANHETNLLAAANKQVDVATNNTENLRRIEIAKPDAYKKIKVIWKSPLIPSDPLVWRKDLPEDTKSVIKSFFLSYGRVGPNKEAAVKKLAALQLAPFKDSSDAQLYPVRQLQLFRDRTKLVNDDKLDAAEKNRKIAAIDAELARLKVLASTQAGS